MNKLLVMMILAGLSIESQAAEYGHVISSTPVVQQVPAPQQSCWDEQVQVQQPRSTAGAVLGGIAGGVIGSTVGRGGGQLAATAVGAITGAVVGDRVDNQNTQTTTQTIRRCQTTQTQQQRTVGYDVTYEYAGQRYTARMANDPGEWVPIAVNVQGATTPAPAPVTTTGVESTVPTTTVIQDSPVYVYQRPPVYWGPSVFFDFGYGRHYGGYGRRW